MKIEHLDTLFAEITKTVKYQKMETEYFTKEKVRRDAEETLQRALARQDTIAKFIKTAQVNLDFMTIKQDGNTVFPDYLKKLFETRAGQKEQCTYREVSDKADADEITAAVKIPGINIESIPIKWVTEKEFVLSLAQVSRENIDTASHRTNTTEVVLLAGKKGGFRNEVDPQRSCITVAVLDCSVLSIPMIEIEWSMCPLYWNQVLDETLFALARPESTIRLLVEKYGTPEELAQKNEY